MVHNGIEYGLMAAYAEGLNILKHANAGKAKQAHDAETTPLRNPEHYQYDLDLADIAEVWRRGSVITSWLLDLTAQALASDPQLEGFGGRVSDSGEGRWTLDAANDVGVPALVLSAALFERFASAARRCSRTRCSRRCGSGSAVTRRRSERSAREAPLGRARVFRSHRRPGLQEDLPGAPGDGEEGPARLPGRRRRQVRLSARAARGARQGQRDRERRRRRSRGVPRAGATAAVRGRRLRRPRHLRAPARRARKAERPVHYLAIPPSMFPTVVQQLQRAGAARRTRA
jgi:hypothetical protein